MVIHIPMDGLQVSTKGQSLVINEALKARSGLQSWHVWSSATLGHTIILLGKWQWKVAINQLVSWLEGPIYIQILLYIWVSLICMAYGAPTLTFEQNHHHNWKYMQIPCLIAASKTTTYIILGANKIPYKDHAKS